MGKGLILVPLFNSSLLIEVALMNSFEVMLSPCRVLFKSKYYSKYWFVMFFEIDELLVELDIVELFKFEED